VSSTSVIKEAAFQATDLNRRHREVLDAARHGSALIRDKDGLALLLEPAANAVHRTQMVAWLLSALRVERALHRPVDQRTAWDFGDLGWIADLDPDDQPVFLDGFLALLLKNADADYTDEVEDYLADWRATAQAWSDPDLRAALLQEHTSPLHNVEL
jgi:hypothetical protein